jgi:pimeloyl-ACP methyl ester carboxylesterase
MECLFRAFGETHRRRRNRALLKRRLAIVLKGMAIFIVAALVAGVAYEQLGCWPDRSRLPQIGKSVDIGGRSLNIFCSRTNGPTVIFESGGDGPGLEWAPIQTEVAKFTQAWWYDRADIGWTDPGPYPRTCAAVVRDPHALLKQARVPTPYVLAGASFGGLNARVHGGLFPKEVAGIVLIDSAHEDEPQRAPKFYLAHTAPRLLWHPLALTRQQPISRFGFTRCKLALRGFQPAGARSLSRTALTRASPRMSSSLLPRCCNTGSDRGGEQEVTGCRPRSAASRAAAGCATCKWKLSRSAPLPIVFKFAVELAAA